MTSLKRILILIFYNLIVATTVILSAGNKDAVSKEDYGVEIWRSKNCSACHSIFGLGGHIGPDLTNTYSKGGKEYLDNVLKNGLRNMPDLKLSKTERKKLIQYLEHVNSLGEYPLKSFTDNPFGKNNDF